MCLVKVWAWSFGAQRWAILSLPDITASHPHLYAIVVPNIRSAGTCACWASFLPQRRTLWTDGEDSISTSCHLLPWKTWANRRPPCIWKCKKPLESSGHYLSWPLLNNNRWCHNVRSESFCVGKLLVMNKTSKFSIFILYYLELRIDTWKL